MQDAEGALCVVCDNQRGNAAFFHDGEAACSELVRNNGVRDGRSWHRLR